MKQLLQIVFSFAIFISTSSCDYSPSGSNYEEINPNPHVIAELTLNDDQDTVIVRGQATLAFASNLPGREYLGQKLEIGNTVISEGQFESRYFFDSQKLSDGYHIITYTVYANSGTGSLADKSRAEIIEVSRKWVLLVDNAPPKPITIRSLKPEGGQLKVTWKPYQGRWFKNIQLKRQIGEGQNYTMFTSTNPNDSVWFDNSYLGGLATYQIVVNLDDRNQNNSATGTTSSYYYPLPTVLTTTYNEAHEGTITFSATPFYKNFESYYLSTPFGSITGNTSTDTVKTFPDPGFGSSFYSNMHTQAKDINYQFSKELNTSYFSIPGPGKPWGPFLNGAIYPNAATDRFFIWQYNSIYLVDATTLKVVHKREVGNQQHGNGPHFAAFSVNGQHLYITLNNVIYKLNPASLETIETYTLKDLLPSTNYTRISLGVSNNNRLMVAANNNWTKKDTVYVVDMNQRKVITKVKADFSDYSQISPDGNALKVQPNLYIERDNKWQLQSSLSNAVGTLAFHPTKQLYATKQGKVITFYSILTGEQKQSVTIETEYYGFAIDPGSGHLYEISETWDMK